MISLNQRNVCHRFFKKELEHSMLFTICSCVALNYGLFTLLKLISCNIAMAKINGPSDHSRLNNSLKCDTTAGSERMISLDQDAMTGFKTHFLHSISSVFKYAPVMEYGGQCE